MYAYTNKSFRAIASAEDLLPGESFSEDVPQSVLLEIKKQEVRTERSERLRSSDWTQLPDNSLSGIEKAAWATYRQLLRSVPQQSGFPTDVEWPSTPQHSEDAGDELPEQS